MEQANHTSEPVTAVFTWTVDPSEAEVFEHMMHDILLVARTFPGHMGATTLHSPMRQGNYQTALRFDTAEHLNTWLNSPIRHRQLRPLEEIAHQETANEATGFDTWFDLPGTYRTPPSRWKLAVSAFITVYVLNLLYLEYLARHLAAWSVLGRALLLPVAAAFILTLIVLPIVSKLHVKRTMPHAPKTTHVRAAS